MKKTRRAITTKIKQGILAEAIDDHIGLWEIILEFKNYFPEAPPNEIRSMTIDLIAEMLKEGSLIAGFPAKGGRDFIRWRLDSQETIQRIKKEWDDLGKDPNIGQVVWFSRPAP